MLVEQEQRVYVFGADSLQASRLPRCESPLDSPQMSTSTTAQGWHRLRPRSNRRASDMPFGYERRYRAWSSDDGNARWLVLGIRAESRLSKDLRSGKFAGAPVRQRVHLIRGEDAPKKATGIRTGVPDNRSRTISRIHHEVGARADLPPGQHHRGVWCWGVGFPRSRQRGCSGCRPKLPPQPVLC
jgi:hypothetical protein